MPRVKAAPAPEPHLAAKQAAMRARRAWQIYLLCDEAETRAIAAGRAPALADIRRQARAALGSTTSRKSAQQSTD